MIIVDDTSRVRCGDICGRCRAVGRAFDSGGTDSDPGPMCKDLLKVVLL